MEVCLEMEVCQSIMPLFQSSSLGRMCYPVPSLPCVSSVMLVLLELWLPPSALSPHLQQLQQAALTSSAVRTRHLTA